VIGPSDAGLSQLSFDVIFELLMRNLCTRSGGSPGARGTEEKTIRQKSSVLAVLGTGGQIYRLPKGMGALHLLRAQPSANQKSAVFFRFFLPLLPPPVRFTNLNGSFPHLFTFTQGFFCNGTRRYGVPAPFPSYEK